MFKMDMMNVWVFFSAFSSIVQWNWILSTLKAAYLTYTIIPHIKKTIIYRLLSLLVVSKIFIFKFLWMFAGPIALQQTNLSRKSRIGPVEKWWNFDSLLIDGMLTKMLPPFISARVSVMRLTKASAIRIKIVKCYNSKPLGLSVIGTIILSCIMYTWRLQHRILNGFWVGWANPSELLAMERKPRTTQHYFITSTCFSCQNILLGQCNYHCNRIFATCQLTHSV